MNTLKLVVLLLLCWPNLIASWTIMAVVRLFWGSSQHVERGVLVVRLHREKWLSKTWGKRWGGFCAGHGAMLDHDASDETKRHELWHTVQVQEDSIAHIVPALMIGAAINWWLALVYLLLAPLLQYGASMLVAWLNGGHPYRDNARERAARDATEGGSRETLHP